MLRTMPPATFERLHAAQPDLALLDVRTPAEYAGVHAAVARNEPLDRLTPGSIRALYDSGVLPAGKPVYLLCQAGKRATQAAEAFLAAGCEHVVVIEGGMAGWEKAGLPVKRGTGGVMSLERQVRITVGALVVLGILLGHLVHADFYWLTGFVGVGLIYAGITDFWDMALLLAKCPWNR